MNKTKPPKASVRTLIRRALKNRYVLSEVRIMRDGTVTGTVGGDTRIFLSATFRNTRGCEPMR